MWAVYALHDPDGPVRYIGISKDPEDRMTRHYRECRYGNTKRKTWLRSILLRGEDPQYSILEWTNDWNEAERRWIAYFKASGANLVNGNEGGITHKGTRVKISYPAIKRVSQRMGVNASGRWATDKMRDAYAKWRRIVDLAKKNGTASQLDQRLTAAGW